LVKVKISFSHGGMTVFWDTAPCNLVEFDRRFRGACASIIRPTAHHQSAPSNPIRHLCLPYIRLPETPNHYTFTLKMANSMFSETMDNSQH
jgi:hypothetical protein